MDKSNLTSHCANHDPDRHGIRISKNSIFYAEENIFCPLDFLHCANDDEDGSEITKPVNDIGWGIMDEIPATEISFIVIQMHQTSRL